MGSRDGVLAIDPTKVPKELLEASRHCDIKYDAAQGWIRFEQQEHPLAITHPHMTISIVQLKEAMAAVLQAECQMVRQMQADLARQVMSHKA